MKKFILLNATICFLSTCFGQQFSYQMFFTDAAGNKDTITLGYDVTATDSIDTAFGEVNIISVPLDTNLDVRVTNYWIDNSSPVTFQTKRQIVFYNCTYTDWSIQPINIFTQHWPVTVTWDSSLFNSICLNGSLFTSINPGGWWDTGSPSDLWLKVLYYSDSATFTSNFDLTWFGYINSHGDSIPVYWQAFGDSTLLLTSVDELAFPKNKLKLFPNPTKDILHLEVPVEFGKIVLVEIYSSIGKLVEASENGSTLDIAAFENGIYFIVVTNSSGEKLAAIAMKI